MKLTPYFLRAPALLLALALLLCCAACGGSTETTETDTEESEETDTAAEDTTSDVEDSGTVNEEETEEEDTEDENTEEESAVEESSVEEETAAAETAAEEIYPLTTEGYTFTCWTTYGPGMEAYLSQIDTFPVFAMAEEITGVSIEFIPCDQSTQPEKMSLYIASGSMPDVMTALASLYSTGGEGTVVDEVAYDLNQFIDLMPNYAAYIENEIGEENYGSLYTDSGYLPAVLTLGSPEYVGMNIRQDWLDELGLEIPTTYDELEEVLLAFKVNYGCQNALYMLEDFGYTNYALASGYDTQISAAMNGLHFYQVDGVVYSGDFNDGAKEYLMMLAEWHAEGLFSSDCITYKNVNDNADVIYKDDCGVWVSEAEFLTDSYTVNAADEDFNPVPMADVGKVEGQMLHMYGTDLKIDGQSGWSITTSCTEPELVCQYIDWFFSEEGYLAANWGTEGVTYEVDEDGELYYTDIILNSTEYSTSKIALTMYTGTPLPCGTSLEASNAILDPIIPAAGEVYNANQDGAYTFEYSMTNDEMTEFSTISADILTKKAEVVAQIILGEADISAYDELLEFAYDVGLERAIELVQTAYDRSN